METKTRSKLRVSRPRQEQDQDQDQEDHVETKPSQDLDKVQKMCWNQQDYNHLHEQKHHVTVWEFTQLIRRRDKKKKQGKIYIVTCFGTRCILLVAFEEGHVIIIMMLHQECHVRDQDITRTKECERDHVEVVSRPRPVWSATWLQ